MTSPSVMADFPRQFPTHPPLPPPPHKGTERNEDDVTVRGWHPVRMNNVC